METEKPKYICLLMITQEETEEQGFELKIELPCAPAIPLLGIYPEKTIIQKETCTTIFIAALFTIDRTWKQPKCLSTEECKIVLISPPSGKGASQNKQSNLPYFTMIQGAAL